MDISQEFFDALLEIRRSENHFMQLAGIRITDAGEGWAHLELDPTDQHLNPQGTVQGGALMTMVDAAMATALVSFNEHIATVDMNYHFLAPVHADDHVICKARIMKNGKRIVITEGTIQVGDRVVGQATATFARTGKKYVEEFPEEANRYGEKKKSTSK